MKLIFDSKDYYLELETDVKSDNDVIKFLNRKAIDRCNIEFKNIIDKNIINPEPIKLPISNNKPLRHSPPLFGKFQLNYKLKSFEIIYNLIYNGRKKIKNFSESELNKLYLYTQDGSPSWMTHNISIYYNINYLIKTNLSI